MNKVVRGSIRRAYESNPSDAVGFAVREIQAQPTGRTRRLALAAVLEISEDLYNKVATVIETQFRTRKETREMTTTSDEEENFDGPIRDLRKINPEDLAAHITHTLCELIPSLEQIQLRTWTPDAVLELAADICGTKADEYKAG